MIKAINQHGQEAEFSERVWEMMPKHKNGWVEIGEKVGNVKIPDKIVEYQAKLKDEQEQKPYPKYPIEAKTELVDKVIVEKGKIPTKRRLPKNDSKK